MVEWKHADNSRHTRLSIPGTEVKSGAGETFCKRADLAWRGKRSSTEEAEEANPSNPAARPSETTGNARGRQ